MDLPGFLWASGTAAVFAALPIVSEHSALAVIDPVKCGTLPPTPDLMPFRAADADFPGTLKGRFGSSLLHFCLFWILGSLLEGILFGEVLFFPQNLHAATPTEIQTNARQMQPADVSEPVWFEEEAPPIVWFVHGMLFMRDDFERELILQNLELFMDPYEDQRAVFEGYTGFRGRWMESRDYAVFDSFDEAHNSFFSIYHKGKKQILAQGHDLRDDRRYHLALPTHFQAADVEDNRLVVAMPGWWLTNYLLPESPFYELVNQNPETVFVMEVVLK